MLLRRWVARSFVVLSSASVLSMGVASPAMAQGAALAVEDALTLATLLRTDPDWSAAAERLAAARNRRVAWVMRHTSRQARMLQHPPGHERHALEQWHEPVELVGRKRLQEMIPGAERLRATGRT